MSKKCPRGQILRNGYTAKRGSKTVKVAASCIRATSVRGTKRSVEDRAAIKKRTKRQEQVAKKYGHVECPPGQIERAGYMRKAYSRKSYTRKSGTRVKSSNVRSAEAKPVCIAKRGSGSGYKIPTVLEKGDLKKFGYGNVRDLSINERHDALTRAVESVKNPLSIFRKLIVISTLNRNTNPDTADIFYDDAYWLRSKFGLMATGPDTESNSRSKSRSKSKSTSKSKNTRSSGSKSTRKSSVTSSKKKMSGGKSSSSKSSGRKSSGRKSSGSKSSGSKSSGSKSSTGSRTKLSGSKSTGSKKNK